ncbi:hypothetical protein BH09ACT8_BH09ACT8_08530 [soil metagenome]
MTAILPADAAASTPRRLTHAAAGIAIAILAAAVLGWFVWPSPPGPTLLHTGTPHYLVTATLQSPRLGASGVDIAVTARDAHSVAVRVRSVQVQAVMPLMGYATEPIVTTPGPADYHWRAAGLPLMMTGPWQLLVSVSYTGGADHLTLPFWVSG